MAMLAEPKRKQKFSFDPRNTNWSNDESKFGHKLMEKMGWSMGKGLGANEDGKTENISVSLKNDTRGVGCKKSHVDNWIAHQDDFNALLSDLQQDHSTDDSKPEAGKKVISLEQKSRTSKGRLHYQKFTKGKDLSLKSETDLDCVFGKRKSQSNTLQPQSKPSSDSEEHCHGFNTVTSTDSVQDYFKRKMAEKQNKLSGNVDDSGEKVDVKKNENKITYTDCNMELNDIPVNKKKDKKKSKKRKIDHKGSDDAVESIDGSAEGIVEVEEVDSVEVVKKKKKSKKNKQNEDESERFEGDTVNDASTDKQNENTDGEELSRKKQKKKKRNPKKDSEEMKTDETVLSKQLVENQENVSEDIPKKKKNKKRKKEANDFEDEIPKKKITFAIGDDDEVSTENNQEDVKPQKAAVKEERKEPDCTEQEVKIVTQSESSSTANRNSDGMHSKDKYVKNEHQSVTKPHEQFGVNGAKRKGIHRLSHIEEVNFINESFKGASVQHIQGYTGLRVTTEEVKRKFYNQATGYKGSAKFKKRK